MKCPYCANEMQKGGTTFMSMQGFGLMLVSFIAETEKERGFFARETKEKSVFSGEETEAYYCADCNKMMPILTIK